MKLADIIKDPDIYPRTQISHQTIENYAEALKAGARFPSILVQNISEDGKAKTIILDGFHRLEAYKKAGLDGLEVTHWRDEILDKAEWLEKLRIVSTQCNLAHGDRLRERDLEFQTLRIVAGRPINGLVGIIKEMADTFGVSEGYMSQLIGAEVNRRKASRDAVAYRLHLLGWTQEEIAEVTGFADRTGVSKMLKIFDGKLFQQEYTSGLTPEQIAQYHNLDQPLVWAILLGGKDDIDRFKLFGNENYGNTQPRMSDFWKFNQRDPRLGLATFPRNLYGQEVLNILYRYSKQGDLVVDPMAGGGVTIDACLVMNRRCRAYDIAPTKSERKDIKQHDAREELPPRAKGCDLIILDLPYYKKKDEQGFLNFMDEVLDVLELPEPPEHSPNCQWCGYISRLTERA